MGKKKKRQSGTCRDASFFYFRRELDFPAGFTLRATFSILIYEEVCRLEDSGTRDTLAVFRRLAFSLQLGKVPFQGPPKRGYLNTALSPADPVIMRQFIFKRPVIFKIFLQCSIRAVVFLHCVCHTGLKGANHIRCFFQSRACRQPPTVLCVWYACRFVPLAKRTDCAAKRYVGAIC